MSKVELLQQDIATVLSSGPVLLSELMAELKGEGWRGVSRRWSGTSKRVLDEVIRNMGGSFAGRRHGAGFAVYVGLSSFDEVLDYRTQKLVHVVPCNAY